MSATDASRASATRLQVACEASTLVRGSPSGVDRWARSVLRSLVGARPAWQFTLCAWAGQEVADDEFPRRLGPLKTAPLTSYRAFRALELLRLPLPFDVLTRTDPDVWLFPNFERLPVRRSSATVSVVYDRSFALPDPFSSRRHRAYLERAVRTAARRSDVLVTISEFVRSELTAAYDLDPAAIHVVPGAVDPFAFRNVTDPEQTAVMDRHGLDRPYLLHVGAMHSRKNLVRLIEAYDMLPRALRGAFDLVLAGGPDRHSAATLAAASRVRSEGRVRLLGFVAETDLAALYSASALVVVPSLYEGFGLPVLEAMACGAAVLADSGTALPEAGGAAGAYVDARDVVALSASVRDLLEDEPRRERMAALGRARALEQSWSHSGELMAAACSAAVVRRGTSA